MQLHLQGRDEHRGGAPSWHRAAPGPVLPRADLSTAPPCRRGLPPLLPGLPVLLGSHRGLRRLTRTLLGGLRKVQEAAVRGLWVPARSHLPSAGAIWGSGSSAVGSKAALGRGGATGAEVSQGKAGAGATKASQRGKGRKEKCKFYITKKPS